MTFPHNVFVWFSQTVNVWILNGHPDETVSARAHRQQDKCRWRIVRQVTNSLFFWQQDHCYTSYAQDVHRAQKILERVN